MHSSRGNNTSRCIGPEARVHVACFKNSMDTSGHTQGRVSESKLGGVQAEECTLGLTCHSKTTGVTLAVIVTIREPRHRSDQIFPLELFILLGTYCREQECQQRNWALVALQSPKEVKQ